MSKVIYIPALNEQTWLHWSYRGSASRLRNFSRGRNPHIRNVTTQWVKERLARAGSKCEPAPRVSINRGTYWMETIRLRNIESGLIQATEESRILAAFHSELNRVWGDVRATEPVIDRLRAVVSRYVEGLKKANDWNNAINHWDRDSPMNCIADNTGHGWESYLLEACRWNGEPQFMKVNNRRVFFAAMEASVGIPARRNLIVPGRIGSVKPDGLGVEQDGNVVIFEIKGPQDVLDPLLAVVQGVLGALAVYARRVNIVTLLKQGHQKRPAINNVRIDDKAAGLIVYILISTGRRGNLAPRVTQNDIDMIRHLLAACSMIQEIAIMRIDRATRDRFHADELPFLPSLTAASMWSQSG